MKKEEVKGVGDLTISRTQILDYLNCGYRWDLSYRRGISPVVVQEKMDLGTVVHRGMQFAIKRYVETGKTSAKSQMVAINDGTERWREEMTKEKGERMNVEMEAQLEVLRDEARIISGRALEHFELEDWEVAKGMDGKPMLEREYVVKCPPWKGFRTIPDLVARPRSGPKGAGWWLIDWKSRSQMEDDEAEEVNLQFATMQYVLSREEPKLQMEGSILWQVRSSVPKWPKQNKDGSMSRAKISTDWETYKKALLEAKLDPKAYEEEMRPKLEEMQWFKSIPQHRPQEECEAVWNEIVLPVAAAMARDPLVVRRWVHQAFGCKGCWARQLCLAELRGDDTEFLLQTDYIDRRNPRERVNLGEGTKFELN